MEESLLDSGNTAWILISAALVLLMLPGLALFYGGMVRAKTALNMMMMVFGSLFVVGVLWILFGYSFAFGDSVSQAGLVGSPTEFLGLEGLMADDPEASLPIMAFVGFQAMFACVTVALIAGAVADRAKYSTWLVFSALFATIVYFPVAHWVFAFDAEGYTGGWIANDVGAIDFAGGTAVHINAGAAGLACALVLGRRVGWPKAALKPHNLPLVMLGAGLLWFGWFGFNAGSALAADNTAAVVLVNTLAATCAAALAWLLTERLRDGKATSLGAASGVVAGLVAITPACSAVSPVGALLVGAITGVLCALAVGLKYRFGFDDSLDVVGVHLVGGLAGTLLIGFLATADAPAGVDGLLYGGGADQLWRQAVGAFAVLAFSFIVSLIIAKALDATMGFRVDEEDEFIGVDLSQHAEGAYVLTDASASGGLSVAGSSSGAKEGAKA